MEIFESEKANLCIPCKQTRAREFAVHEWIVDHPNPKLVYSRLRRAPSSASVLRCGTRLAAACYAWCFANLLLASLAWSANDDYQLMDQAHSWAHQAKAMADPSLRIVSLANPAPLASPLHIIDVKLFNDMIWLIKIMESHGTIHSVWWAKGPCDFRLDH